MAVKLIVTFHNSNPNTIWNRLAAKLGREPTVTEAKAEVRRIMAEAECTLAEAGRLRHQRKR
jgi:type IV secretory pathway ATPase VirB11/archaellum biosynthesis ATPase